MDLVDAQEELLNILHAAVNDGACELYLFAVRDRLFVIHDGVGGPRLATLDDGAEVYRTFRDTIEGRDAAALAARPPAASCLDLTVSGKKAHFDITTAGVIVVRITREAGAATVSPAPAHLQPEQDDVVAEIDEGELAEALDALPAEAPAKPPPPPHDDGEEDASGAVAPPPAREGTQEIDLDAIMESRPLEPAPKEQPPPASKPEPPRERTPREQAQTLIEDVLMARKPFPREVITMVPSEMARQLAFVPIRLHGATLFIAMGEAGNPAEAQAYLDREVAVIRLDSGRFTELQTCYRTDPRHKRGQK